MFYNLHALIFCIFSSDIRLVVGFPRVVRSPYSITVEFLGDRIGTPPHETSNTANAVLLLLIPSDFLAVALRELAPGFVFFSCFYSLIFSLSSVLIQKRI